jgi:hypothetical protein
MHSFYYPFQKHAFFLLPISKTCVLLASPCICITNQCDALYIFTSLGYHTATCFRLICGPSSGGRVYIRGKWYLFFYWN